MFNRDRLKNVLVHYKQDFAKNQWPEEKYKWEAVKNFQDNWDVNAKDFANMLTRSLAKTANLLASVNNFPAKILQDYAKIVPEKVRAMFIELFDEDIEVYTRIEKFKIRAAMLLEDHKTSAAQHFQHENAISTYLWLRYPDQYYIYKLSEIKAVVNELECDYTFKKGAYADNIRNFLLLYNEIRTELESDEELIHILNSQLTDSCYPDTKLCTLTIDVGYYIGHGFIADEKWWPSVSEYSPNLSVSEWTNLLDDKDVFYPESLEIMKRMMDFGGQATCTQLALKYGETKNFYNAGSSSLAKRIAETAGCPIMSKEDGNSRWWPILYLGKTADKDEEGSFTWKLRDELAEALKEMALSDVELYADQAPVIWKISHGTESTGIPKSIKKILEERHVIVVNKDTRAKAGMQAAQGESFIHSMKKGDFFYLCYGNSIQLLGQVTSDEAAPNPEMQEAWYERDYKVIAQSLDTKPYSNTHKWWTPNDNSTCIKVGEQEKKLFEEVILEPYFNKTLVDLVSEEPPKKLDKYDKSDFLNKVYMSESRYDMLAAILKNKKNVILQGAPGVGKTFAAKRLAYSIMGEIDESRIDFVQFHQNYSYEDFILGYKPDNDGFKLKPGVFYKFCEKAKNQRDKDFFFIIDEINRGNLSKIFGELLMLIERDYRGTEVTLAYNGEPFSVPANLHIIGMMNTADRSLAMIDYALRRRFSFFEMEPGFESEGFIKYQNSMNDETFNELISRIKELNKEITIDKSLGKGFCIGQSYFCEQETCEEKWMRSVVDYDILPMLGEYWFDDGAKYQQWENILHGVFQ